MAITRTAIVNDSGGGTDGTGLDNAWKQELYDQIDAALAAGGSVDVGVCEGRLTLTSATPVTTADVTAATNIYWTPFKGKNVALYDGVSAWVLRAFAETTLALGTVTSGLPYDVFAYDNAGTLALEKLAWTNGTTRATALVLQDGVLCKTGALTRRYLGTFYTTSTTTTEDSTVKRFLWNYYNRVTRPLLRRETAGSWTYTTATARQANGNTANKVEVIIGWADTPVDLTVAVLVGNSVGGAVPSYIGIGQNSLTVVTAGQIGGDFYPPPSASMLLVAVTARLLVSPVVGYHYFAWLEYSTATGTTTWYTTNLLTNTAGLVGRIEG